MNVTFQRHEHGAWCHPSADGCPAEMPAPALTEAEAARVAAFDAAPVPPEVQMETVARAICNSDWETNAGWAKTDGYERGVYRRLAAAAIAAMPPNACTGCAHCDGVRARAALASPAPAPQGERDGWTADGWDRTDAAEDAR